MLLNIRYLSSKSYCTKLWNLSQFKSSAQVIKNVNKISTRSIRTDTLSKTSDALVGKWLLGISGMASVAVILGGVTRLTESGLSMVSWKLLGEKLPRSQSDWEDEFEKYKQFPEYAMKNAEMDLKEFKFIFYMEYIHRMWGRTIGAAFLVPAIYFWRRGFFNRNTKIRVSVLGALLGLQGLLGWYMVKSGLEDRFQDVNDVPRVSQYRLASHLGLAFIFYAFSLSSALNKLLTLQKINIADRKNLVNIRWLSHMSKALVFLTAISGAFVAGLDAGLIYNSFPKMGDKWVPDEILNFKPIYKNFTENPTTVQFNHRILGISTLTVISGLWFFSRKAVIPSRAKWALNSIVTMAWIQVGLGITTLLTYVPTPIAAAHQSGSLLLLSFAMWLTHEMKALKYIPK